MGINGHCIWIRNCECSSFRVSTKKEDQVGLCQLAQLTDIDLSNNLLTGDVPACFKHIQRYIFLLWLAFQLSLSELTCFTVFEQIKDGRKLLPEQRHNEPSWLAMYGDVSFNTLQSLMKFNPIVSTMVLLSFFAVCRCVSVILQEHVEITYGQIHLAVPLDKIIYYLDEIALCICFVVSYFHTILSNYRCSIY